MSSFCKWNRGPNGRVQVLMGCYNVCQNHPFLSLSTPTQSHQNNINSCHLLPGHIKAGLIQITCQCWEVLGFQSTCWFSWKRLLFRADSLYLQAPFWFLEILIMCCSQIAVKLPGKQTIAGVNKDDNSESAQLPLSVQHSLTQSTSKHKHQAWTQDSDRHRC